jgi:hypothetical protein
MTNDIESQLTNDTESQDSLTIDVERNINLKQRIINWFGDFSKSNCGKVLFPIFVLICIILYLILSPIIAIALLVNAIYTGDSEDITIFYITLIIALAVYIGIPLSVLYEIKKYKHYSS